nr:unknown [Zea mays]
MENLDSEREKNEVMQKQLEALSFLDKRKATKPKLVTDKFPSVSGAPPSSDQMIVAVQQQTPVALPSKVPPAKGTKRVAPLPRRARVRGALLQDTEENADDNT